MRLTILDRGHGFGTKALFALIRAASRQKILDVVKLVEYRPDFYGDPMSKVTQEAMRGASSWSVGDRELMAAFISKINQCEFCTKAHSAVADLAYGNKKVSAVVCDLESSGIDETLRATLLMLGKLTREHSVDVDDMRAVIAAGASLQQIEDALAVCFSFTLSDVWPILSASRCLPHRLSMPARNTFSRAATTEKGGCWPARLCWSINANRLVTRPKPRLVPICVHADWNSTAWAREPTEVAMSVFRTDPLNDAQPMLNECLGFIRESTDNQGADLRTGQSETS
jgi:AhpD family alkylhydroperoxidase